MIIAIDGPAGSGKSTVAKNLSEKLDFTYLSSGKIYRIIAYHLLKENIDTDNVEKIKNEIDNIVITYNKELYLNNAAVESKINTEVISEQTSKISRHSFIRKYVDKIINSISQDRDIIMDGRDIGTKVFPNADYKFYLIASVEVRAKRRFKELNEKGIDAVYDEVYNAIKKRDYNDSNREIAPLKKASDAVEIDSSDKSVEEVVDEMLKIINSD